MGRKQKQKAARKIQANKNQNSAAVDANKSQAAASNNTKEQKTDGVSNQKAAGSASNQNAGGASASTSSDDRCIPDFQIFDYDEVKKDAKHFRKHNKIGKGRLGPVYKAKLQTGQIVAVKKLNVLGHEYDDEFLTKTVELACVCHPNLVNLIGFATETAHGLIHRPKQRLLVYEFMPSGSLDKYLHANLKPQSNGLDWKKRMTIALCTAKVLNYLHNEADPYVLFGYLKTSNILLNDTFLPRLSGWGLSQFGDVADVSIRDQAYWPPEYYHTGIATKKSDVYSFGAILLELITGRRAIEIMKEYKNLVDWFHWTSNPMKMEDVDKLDEVMVDPLLRGKTGIRDSIFKAVILAKICLRRELRRRPVTLDVMQSMEVISMAISPTAGSDTIEQVQQRRSKPEAGNER